MTKKSKKFFLSVSLLLLSINHSFSQQFETSKSNIYSVYIKNFIAYSIYSYFKLNENNFSDGKPPHDFLERYSFILDTNEYYKIKIIPSSILFPDTNLMLFEIYCNNLEYIINKNGYEEWSANIHWDYKDPSMYKSLLGFDKRNSQYVYISGHLFLDNIGSYFWDNKKIINGEKYIIFKYYNYEPDSVKVINNRIFQFYSRNMQKSYQIDLKSEESSLNLIEIGTK